MAAGDADADFSGVKCQQTLTVGQSTDKYGSVAGSSTNLNWTG